MRGPSEVPDAEAFDVVVELLVELGGAAGAGDGSDGIDRAEAASLDDRICEAVCRATQLERAVLFLYDRSRRLVLPAGSHGVPAETLAHAYGTLEEAPIAQRAFARNDVIVAPRLAGAVPSRYAHVPGVAAVSCTPVAAAGRRLGVILSDRVGEPFALSVEERRKMRALGTAAALATTVRQATAERERARLLLERTELAREVHEGVIQRLFGVSMALASSAEAETDLGRRCAAQIELALGELRVALVRPLTPSADQLRTTLRGELDRLGAYYKHLPLDVFWTAGVVVPEDLEPLAVSVLTEALRNAERHATPTQVRIAVGRDAGAFALEIRNDGLRDDGSAPRSTGLGLRLAAYQALEHGGMLEFGREQDEWRVRLILPLA